jgi:hypothetical protein
MIGEFFNSKGLIVSPATQARPAGSLLTRGSKQLIEHETIRRNKRQSKSMAIDKADWKTH